MRRRFVAWLLAGFTAATVPMLGSMAAGAQTWSEYRPAGGGFRVEMPGTPTVTTHDIDIDGGRVAAQIRAAVSLPETVYTVVYLDYPADVGHGMPPQRLLERSRDNIARQRELRSDAALTIDGVPAREFVVVTKENVAVVMRVVWFENRLFQIAVADLDPAVGSTPAARRFLESFSLVK